MRLRTLERRCCSCVFFSVWEFCAFPSERFLRAIHDVVPAGKQIHMIVDNYSTHKHAKVKRWLRRHPRFHMHFTPTSSSWLNMVERVFRDLTQTRLRRGICRSVEELIIAIDEYIPFLFIALRSMHHRLDDWCSLSCQSGPELEPG